MMTVGNSRTRPLLSTIPINEIGFNDAGNAKTWLRFRNIFFYKKGCMRSPQPDFSENCIRTWLIKHLINIS